MNTMVNIEPMSDHTYQLFQKLIYEKTGIHMRDCKQILVANRLRKRLLCLGLSSYEAYYRYLRERPDAAEELQQFIDAVSTNETCFFREEGQFEVLSVRILPGYLQRAAPLKIWCAGCSTGEEAYTLAIVLREAAGGSWPAPLEIVATDINRQVIERARRGVYREYSLRFVPPALRKRHFRAAPGPELEVREELRENIRFMVHNLLADEPPGAAFDLIFCRNVMIYFDKPTQKRLVDEMFAGVLRPDGYLFIGHSESLTGTSERFRYVREYRMPIYRKGSGS
jgi:chemotaxis protein methyltransferase CheR